MELEPSVSLAGHHADFIALDGSVSLRLDFDDASETVEGAKRTLTWNVCTQPWESGGTCWCCVSAAAGRASPASPTTASAAGRRSSSRRATRRPWRRPTRRLRRQRTRRPWAPTDTPTPAPEVSGVSLDDYTARCSAFRLKALEEGSTYGDIAAGLANTIEAMESTDPPAETADWHNKTFALIQAVKAWSTHNQQKTS